MKKSIISLGMAALLLATPTPIFASNVSSPTQQEISGVGLTAASQYINNYQRSSWYKDSNDVPSSYRYTFTDSNGKTWSGVLSLSKIELTNLGTSYWYYGLYSGYVYLVEQN
ncbi:hypothetical protein D3C76_118850 [compost metagenome]